MLCFPKLVAMLVAMLIRLIIRLMMALVMRVVREVAFELGDVMLHLSQLTANVELVLMGQLENMVHDWVPSMMAPSAPTQSQQGSGHPPMAPGGTMNGGDLGQPAPPIPPSNFFTPLLLLVNLVLQLRTHRQGGLGNVWGLWVFLFSNFWKKAIACCTFIAPDVQTNRHDWHCQMEKRRVNLVSHQQPEEGREWMELTFTFKCFWELWYQNWRPAGCFKFKRYLHHPSTTCVRIMSLFVFQFLEEGNCLLYLYCTGCANKSTRLTLPNGEKKSEPCFAPAARRRQGVNI